VLLAAVEGEATDFARELGVGTERLVMGGRSMGGRMCSMAIADGLPAAGLVAIAYPLHPPGRPDRLRTEHLPRLSVPCLFVSGTADSFATPAELEVAFALIPGPVTTVWIDGGRHELKNKDKVVAEAVTTWLATLAPSVSPPGPRARAPRGRATARLTPPTPPPVPGGDPPG
jgi:predicted alpha/beta-hydrolase family hydrolase